MVARTLAILAGGATCALLLQGCPEQPEFECLLARGPYSARYTLVEGTGECAEFKGDIIGVEQYFAVVDKKQDLTRSTVAIQVNTVGSTAATRGPDADPAHKLYSFGKLNSNKPSGRFCTVNSLNAAQVDVPEIPPAEAGAPEQPVDDAGADASVSEGGTSDDAGEADSGAEEVAPPDPGQPAVSLKYEWSNVRFLMTEKIPGEAFDGDLTITKDGCSAKYRVDAIFYYKPFTSGGLGACAPVIDEATGELGEPDDFQCSSKPDPAHGVAVGSGINPSIPVKCDPDLKFCVTTKSIEDL